MTDRVYLPKLLHVRRSLTDIENGRGRHRRKLRAWLKAREADLEGTATTAAVNSVDDTDSTSATSVFTITGLPTDGDTVTIGTRVYTWVDSLSGAEDEILIGANESTNGANLRRALLGDDLTQGFDHNALTANDDVSAENAGGVVTVTAKVDGTDGNGIATTESTSNASWGASATAGGVDGDLIETTAAHGWATGDGPFEVASDGSVPAGLDADELYYVRVVTTTEVQLYKTATHALKNTQRVNITGAGSGNITLGPAVSEQSIIEHMRAGETPEALQNSSDIDDFV